MADQELIERIKKDFIDFQNQGNDIVKIDNVLVYLEHLSQDVANNVQDVETQRFLTRLSHERNMEILKVNTQHAIANVDRLEECQRLMLKSVIDIGQNALKYITIINGGAGVAMLAFVGNISSKGLAVNGYLKWSLIAFALGVLAAALSNGASYFSQGYFSISYEKKKNKLVEAINAGQNDGKGTRDNEEGEDEKNATRWRNVAIVAAVFGYIFFLAGVIAAYNSMGT